jgi:uncharacterized protein YbaP (TraB family)
MNKKFLAGVTVFIMMSLFFVSTSPASENTAAGEKSFLWKVRSKTGIVFIFGSIHLAKPEIYPLPRKIEESFAKSNVLAVEADPAQATEPNVQRLMLLNAMYTGDDTLQRHLSKKTYELATETMQRFGLPIEMFYKAKPWFVALTIETQELRNLGYTPEYGLDMHFAEQAKGKKKLVELESFDYQIKLLNGFAEREQDLFLFYTLQDLKSLREEIEELMRAWRTGDVKAMESLVTQTLNEYPEIQPIYDTLFYRRNRNIAGRIEQFLQSRDTVFVVVGAAHLVGKEGIIELLKKKGYKTEQM